MSTVTPASSTEREFVHSRLIDAPRERIFRALAEPDHLARWWGPNGFTSSFEIFEFRPGGAWRFVFRGPDGTQYPNEKAAAQGKDIRLGGGAAAIRQYLNAGLVDELHLAISPVALGRGEKLFDGVDLPVLGFRCVVHVATEAATHVVFRKG